MSVDLDASRDAIELMTGGWTAQALCTTVGLQVPELVAQGVRTDDELAAATGADPDGLHRVMRLLVARGVFTGDGNSGYTNTPIAEVLREGENSLREMVLLYGEEFYRAWEHAPAAITSCSSGFEMAYGRPLYGYLDDHPELRRRFQATMQAGSLFFDHVPEALDFAGRTVVDVGGGNGHLLTSILRAEPDARGVLFDRTPVVPLAREYLAGTVGLDRVEVVGGSMFESIPPGGDVYVFCRVLAGWPDDDVVEVFRRCRLQLSSGGRVLVLDRLVTDADPTVLPSLWDLHLLITTGGRHRSVEDFTTMLDRAGFDVERRVTLPLETTGLLAAPRD